MTASTLLSNTFGSRQGTALDSVRHSVSRSLFQKQRVTMALTRGKPVLQATVQLSVVNMCAAWNELIDDAQLSGT